jgi:hypothetical protein
MKLKRVVVLVVVSTAMSILTVPERMASAAADCGEPVAAPKWQVGDTWRFQDELGGENRQTVTGMEAGLVRIEVARIGGNTIQFWDTEYVLRKVIEPDGTVVDRPTPTRWVFLGQKMLDFPLQVGKTWRVSHEYDLVTFWDTYRVLACEEVAIIAGKLPALRMEVTRRRTGIGRPWQGVFHEWYAPSVKRSVRRMYQRPDFPERLRDWELLKFQVR